MQVSCWAPGVPRISAARHYSTMFLQTLSTFSSRTATAVFPRGMIMQISLAVKEHFVVRSRWWRIHWNIRAMEWSELLSLRRVVLYEMNKSFKRRWITYIPSAFLGCFGDGNWDTHWNAFSEIIAFRCGYDTVVNESLRIAITWYCLNRSGALSCIWITWLSNSVNVIECFAQYVPPVFHVPSKWEDVSKSP